MRIKDIHRIYFIGIGGIGMSALARYFNHMGVSVSGYDRTPTLLTSELEQEGILITYDDSLETLAKDVNLVVYTPAIPQNHKQFNYYKENNYPLKKRAEVLGLIANELTNISIAGSHGKTSTSALVAHLMHEAQKDSAAFLGGVAMNYDSNFIHGNTYAVVEADEFDRSFLQLHPDICLVTSIDTDHLDIYKNLEAIQQSFTEFLLQVKNSGTIFLHESVDAAVIQKDVENYSYSYNNDATDYYASDISVKNGATEFTLHTPQGVVSNLILNYGGKHNVENAIGACAVALKAGVTSDDLRKGLASFQGVRRRFQTAFKSDKRIYIDDYAHHPREIDAVVQTVRDLYPDQKVTIIFQPHLYSRTSDLAEEFGQALSQVEHAIVLPIYPARELPISGVSSELIVNYIQHTEKYIIQKDNILDFLKSNYTEGVLMTVGAGDIDTLVKPITNWLKSMSDE